MSVRTGPCTSAQRRLWVLAQIEPESLEYLIPFAFRLRGPLDAAALGAALDELVRRHEALRTRFAVRNGLPVQVVEAPGRLWMPSVDLGEGDRPLADRERAAAELVDGELLRPFDLSRAPLVRAVLVRLGADDHVLGMVIHHAVFDAWSLTVLASELGTLYDALAAGAEAALEAPGPHPIDVALRQEAAPADAELEHWRRRLAGAPALELPADLPRPARRSGRGAEHTFLLDPQSSAEVVALARARRATPYVVLLAAFAALLQRYTGESDLSVGAPTASRDEVELERAVGFLINMVVLRLDLSGDPTFGELLSRVRRVVLDAYAHHDAPFDRVVEALNPPRDRSRTPLFQVMFNLQEFFGSIIDFGAVEISEWPVANLGAQVDLMLDVFHRGDYFHCRITYSTDLYEPATVARIGEHFAALVRSAVAGVDRPLSALAMLGEAERELVVRGWNRTDRPFPGACLHELVAEAARRAPDEVAVEDASARLTRADLEARANRLARELVARGAGPGTAVGVCLGRTPMLVVALLAVLKAGAAYVPLDPAHPAERGAYMLADSGAALLLRDAGARAPFPEAATIDLDRDWAAIAAAHPATPPAVAALPRQLAYVIYTSGSTGRPKGVEVSHRALVNLLAGVRDDLEVGAGDVVLATTTVAFDVAGTELWLPLLAGARVAIAPGDCPGNPAAMGRAVARFAPTVMQGTPTMWRLLMEAGFRVTSRVRAITMGEALPAGLARQLLEAGLRPWNLYGPTETTIYSTGEPVTASRAVTVGRPLRNQTAYVLDAGRRPVPIGVPGRLHVGGEGVAAGYRGRPDLTAERFVPDPCSGLAGGRLYDTGDVARWRSDGRLEYLGRADNQVKVNGVRVEPGEVEHRLAAHAAIDRAVVTARPDRRGVKRLVAYLLAVAGASRPAPAELRRWLRRDLPDSMVPPEFVWVDAFPTTPNGKLDVRALPSPVALAAEREHVAPATPAEEALADIWREVLAVERIGRSDDFFDLGGHSLAALQVVETVSERMGVTLRSDALFDAPTLADLAALLSGSD